MKILHLLSQKPEATGSGMTVRALIGEASRAGHENFLLAGVDCREPLPEIPHISSSCCTFVEFGGGDLPYDIVGMSDVMPYSSHRFSCLSESQLSMYRECFSRELRKAVVDFRPDIIHSNHLWIMTGIARREFPGIPAVATCHGTDIRQYHLCPNLRETVVEGCSTLDAVFVLTDLHREQVRSIYGIAENRIHVTGTGYDEKLFTPGIKSVEGPLEMIYAGKLSRAKGVIYLLEALQSIEADYILHLAGAGTGAEEEEIRVKAGELGEKVRFHGALPHGELASLMGRSHIFTLPSLYEGFPLVVLEALASGCLTAATALPSLMEIFSDGGWQKYVRLIPPPVMQGPDTPCYSAVPGFIEAMGEALREQMEKARRHRREGAQAFDPALADLLARYRWSSVFAKMEKVYATLLPQN